MSLLVGRQLSLLVGRQLLVQVARQLSLLVGRQLLLLVAKQLSLLVARQLLLQVARQLSLLVARQLLLLVARQLLLQAARQLTLLVARQLLLLVGRQMSLQVGIQSKDTTTTEALSLFPIRNHERVSAPQTAFFLQLERGSFERSNNPEVSGCLNEKDHTHNNNKKGGWVEGNASTESSPFNRYHTTVFSTAVCARTQMAPCD